MNKKINFIEKSKITHGNKYDYSLVEYINSKTKVKIICPEHGIFEQRPDNHKSQGCPKCANIQSSIKQRHNKELFITKSRLIHGDKYDYSLVEYINAKTKVKIICSEHGVFEMSPNVHINCKSGCKLCFNNEQKLSNVDFIEKCRLIHGNKYDYSLVEYINSKTKVKIICPEHGIFEQRPNNHLQGNECPKCQKKELRKRTIKRIEQNKLNGNQLYPNFNIKACDIFNKISEQNDIHIQHAMNGGEFYIKELGYWLDGYDKENNVVYEFDEKYHDNQKQKQKDMLRQQDIINHLKCKFIRIKDE
jgi:hypothetical protein